MLAADLIDHLWQSTLFGCAAGALTLVLRNNGAHTRYWLWFAASTKFLFPFSLLVAAGGAIALRMTPDAAASVFAAAIVQNLTQPLSPAVSSLAQTSPVPAGIGLFVVVAVIWACGFVTVVILRLRGWLHIASALRAAMPLAIDAPIPVKASSSLIEPGIVGVVRPILLLHRDITACLTPHELSAILEHELCHLRRQDNLTAMIHMLIEALFWFHPLVWWVGARMVEERERACDEAVVKSGHDRQTYAEGILKVCKFYVQSPIPCAAGVSGADLKRRLSAIMTGPAAIGVSTAKRLLFVAAGLAVVFGPLMAGLTFMSVARAQAPVGDGINRDAELNAERLADQARPRQQMGIDPKLLDSYAGYYQLAPNAIFTITNAGDHLATRLTGQVVVDVYPESANKFFAKVVHAQISFNADAQGRATELILHQNGLEQSAKRIDEATAQKVEGAIAQRIKDNTPSPGTEAALRRYLESLMRGEPNYADMTPRLAGATREQLPTIRRYFEKWGALRSVTFKGVAANGWDVYQTTFAQGQADWRIAPLDLDGRVRGLLFGELP